MRRVLITGAAGGVARQLMSGLTPRYDVVTTDRTGGPGIDIVGDVTDEKFVAEVTRDVDAVVHLAANPGPNQPWPSLREPNVDAVANVLAAGAPRYVLAGSMHAMGQYLAQGRTPVDPDWPVAPCCPYGATKAFAEALGRTHAYRSGSAVVVLRLGAVTRVPATREVLSGWLGPADLQHLVACALEADVDYAVCQGVSANTGSVVDTRNSIGYRPVLDSAAYADGLPSDPGAIACRPDRPRTGH